MGHELNDATSLEIGRRVAARLREEPHLLQIAHDNLNRWLRQNAEAPGLARCYKEWQTILERPLRDICVVLEAEGEENSRLRQNSPFAGVLSAEEIRSIKAGIRQRQDKTTA